MVAWPVEFFSQLASKHETKSAKAVRTGRGSTMVFVSLFTYYRSSMEEYQAKPRLRVF
jgi:hypothetical protein